jgi:tripartite-type tricarboxylate transporter receptor subunit TctC
MGRTAMTCLSLLTAATIAATAADEVSFRGKTVTMIISSPAGGGTDSTGRLIAPLLGGHLPGNPTVVVRNIPGAEGITAMNYFVKQVAADGTTVSMGSTTQADPLLYRKPQAQYDPTKFAIIGGVGRGGTVMVIRGEVEARLYDKSKPPVVMGALAGVPRSGMLAAAWGVEILGWNVKWVLGYRGTNDLMLALARGEIDMTSTANLFQIQKFIESGRYKFLSQSGSFQNGQIGPRAEFSNVPTFASLVQGKIKDPVVQKAFDYWTNVTALDKWLALPPNTPEAYVRAYRDAYEFAFKDSSFAELGKTISEDFEPMPGRDVEFLIARLGTTPPESVAHISAMLRRQGVSAE